MSHIDITHTPPKGVEPSADSALSLPVNFWFAGVAGRRWLTQIVRTCYDSH